MARYQLGQARVIPIILRPCDWSSAPFGILQPLPRNGQAVTTYGNQDEAFAQIAQHLRSLIQHQQPFTHISPATDQGKQERVIQRLQQWYHDFLTDSLQQATWLDLKLAEKPDALYHPSKSILHTTSYPRQRVSSGASIIQIYEEAHGELLILGEPGSGKSTQLYILALHLIRQIETISTSPLPIIFTLASWAIECASLEAWMSKQLTQIYQVPKNLAQQWVQNHEIIPLLDGLDEIDETVRPKCIAAINHYYQEHLLPLVVCSRNNEYKVASQHERLVLQLAIVVQPLTITQVNTILTKGGQKLAGLHSLYRQNEDLQELAATPLLLNLLIQVYQDTSVGTLSTEGATLQHQVLEQYIQLMVVRQDASTRYIPTSMIHWLSWLARAMRAQKHSEFDPRSLEVYWLSKHLRWRIKWCIGLSGGLIGGLPIALSKGILFGGCVGVIIGLFSAYIEIVSLNTRILQFFIQLFLIALGTWLFITWGATLIRKNLIAEFFMGSFIALFIMLLPRFRHYMIRFWLWRANLFPFNDVAFLEDACARHLLKRVGGTYQFMHRLLLDYFADLE